MDVQYRQVQQLRSSSGGKTWAEVPLVDRGHEYDYLTIDGRNAQGMSFFVAFDRRPSVSDVTGNVLTVQAGQPIPLKDIGGEGRAVWVLPVYRGNVALEDVDIVNQLELQFWFGHRGQMPFAGREFKNGDIVHQFEWTHTAGTIAQGGEATILNLNDLPHLAGLPLSLVVEAWGGLQIGSAAVGAPMMFNLRSEFSDSNSWHRPYMFPGQIGRCRVCMNLPTYRVAEDDAAELYLEASQSSQGASNDAAMRGYLVIGHQREFESYWGGRRKDTVADQNYHWVWAATSYSGKGAAKISAENVNGGVNLVIREYSVHSRLDDIDDSADRYSMIQSTGPTSGNVANYEFDLPPHLMVTAQYASGVTDSEGRISFNTITND